MFFCRRRVTITDLPEFVDLMSYNVSANKSLIEERGGLCKVEALEWGTPSDMKVDMILLSDCIYYEKVSSQRSFTASRLKNCTVIWKRVFEYLTVGYADMPH